MIKPIIQAGVVLLMMNAVYVLAENSLPSEERVYRHQDKSWNREVLRAEATVIPAPVPAPPAPVSAPSPAPSPENNTSEQPVPKNGKLSVEERRALRRQINEASHDLNSRKKAGTE